MLEISDEKIDSKELENIVYSLKTLSSMNTAKIIARWLLFILIFLIIIMFLPWQQNVEGTGFVTALNPSDRPQKVNSAIAGRIKEWRVQEGQLVKKNDTIAVLSEIKTDYFDPELIKRTEEQKSAKEDGMNATEGKVKALENQISALQEALQLSLQKAENKVTQSELKVNSAKADYEAQKNNLKFAQRQFDSYNELFQSKNKKDISLISRTNWEKRNQKLQEVKAKVVSLENKYLNAQNELINARIQLNSVRAEYQTKLAKSESDKSSALAYLASSAGELSKIKNKLSNLVIRNNQYYILAPQDGFIVKVLKTGIGETIKEGGAVCTIMPENPAVATELYVKAMNVPLLSIGRKVRLEFDGFPALQFTGWPSTSVGTFGGKIAVIDRIDSKDGKYRILVVPDKDDEPWPKEVRIGSGVYGWVMLDNVPIWYEIWRQLNGFPASLYDSAPDKENGKDDKEEKKKKKKSGKKIKFKVKK